MHHNVYTKSFLPTFADFDCKMNLKPSAILNYLQEVASKHGEELKIGREDLLKKGIFWVLTSIRYVVDQKITYNEPITVKTWPLAPGRIISDRDYAIEGQFGGKIRASAEWCLLDVNTHRIVQTKAFDYGIDEFYANESQIKRGEKMRPFSEIDCPSEEITVKYSHLDYNDHVNNAKYGDYVQDSLPNGTEIKEFYLQYVHECKLNDVIEVYRKTDGNSTYLDGRTQDDKCVFLAKIL